MDNAPLPRLGPHVHRHIGSHGRAYAGAPAGHSPCADSPAEASGTPHRLLRCAAALEAALDEAVALDPVFMSVAEKRDSLVTLERLASRVTALKLRVVAASADVADAEGHRDVASWMTHRTRGDRRQRRREQRLAEACDGRWRRLGQAMTTGAVHLDQAYVVSRALDDLARVLTDLLGDTSFTPVLTSDRQNEILDQAETHLVEQAASFGPDDLARLGARILQVLAPHVADDAESKKLRDEERHARRVTRLTTQRLGDGTVLVKARVPQHVATRLTTTLEAFTNPRKQCGDAAQPDGPHRATDATGEDLPYEMRLGHAFCALLEGLDPRRLPLHGGSATTLVVTMELDALLRGVGAGQLATGETLSAGEVRRLACTADLVPAVFGTRSELLDLGRTARLFSPGQRRALALRDRQCRAAGCDIPATWCEAHHLLPWGRLGATDLDNGVLLCSHHHHRIHDDRYLHQRLPNGDVRFSRRR